MDLRRNFSLFFGSANLLTVFLLSSFRISNATTYPVGSLKKSSYFEAEADYRGMGEQKWCSSLKRCLQLPGSSFASHCLSSAVFRL
jgi:hypothetical protein